MEQDGQYLKKRLLELSRRAFEKNIVTFSNFLNLNEIHICCQSVREFYSSFQLSGGYSCAERRKEERKLRRSQMNLNLPGPGQQGPRREGSIKAEVAQKGLIAYLFMHQEAAGAIGKRCPPEKFITPEYRRVYNAILGRMIQDTVTMAGIGEILTAEEASVLSGILAKAQDAPPNERDVREYLRVLEEAARKEGTEEWSKTASPDAVKEYLEDLRKKKT